MSGEKDESVCKNMKLTNATRKLSESTDVSCGIGPVRPACLQPCVSIWAFLAFLCFATLLHGVQGTLLVSVLTTLEKRFQLQSSRSGLLVTMGFISGGVGVVFITHFGSKLHVPRLFSVAAILTGMSASLYVLTHAIYGSGRENVSSSKVGLDKSASASSSGFTKAICDPRGGNTMYNASNITEPSQRQSITFDPVPYGLFILAEGIHGLAGVAFWTIGVSFIDDNLSKKTAARVIGFYFGIRFLSPVMSFGLSALFLSYYVDLSDTNLTPDHPQWVGAWWLGYAICGSLAFILSIPLAFFPKRFPRQIPHQQETEGALEKTACEEENVDPSKTSQVPTSVKDLPKALMRLLTNSVLMMFLTAATVDVFQFGLFGFLPKYIEVQFHQPATFGNVFGGMALGVVSFISSPVSGFIASKLKPVTSPAINIKFTAISSVMSTLSFGILLAIGCPELPMAGSRNSHWINVTTQCNSNCSCITTDMDPVCGSDGLVYFSPCHAGCPRPMNESTLTYESCHCIPDGHAVAGHCGTGCIMMIPYVIVTLLSFLFVDLISVPLTNAMLRAVEERDKALSLGFSSIFIGLGVIPAPLLYGAIIDGTCTLPQLDHDGNPSGACLQYDNEEFRFRLHGITFAVKGTAAVLYFLTWLHARHVEKRQPKLPLQADETANERSETL